MYVSKKPAVRTTTPPIHAPNMIFFAFLLSLNLSAIISFLLSAVLSIYARILVLIILQRKMDFCNLRFLFISDNKLFYLLITRTLLIRRCIDFQEFIIFFVTVKISSVMTADSRQSKPFLLSSLYVFSYALPVIVFNCHSEKLSAQLTNALSKASYKPLSFSSFCIAKSAIIETIP